MIKKILIANRGEIAVRIIKTCKKLNIATVAVYSDVDKASLFVELADESYSLNGLTALETYLDINKILTIAKLSGADAVHPGYGFLSENADFADLITAAGLIFIGPSSNAIRAMGLKSTAKILMAQAKVNTLPGYNGEDQTDQTLILEAQKIGYPILIKATAGGGGKGMRIVYQAAELLTAVAGAKREALKNFANDQIILEKYLVNPRHIEVQIVCDNHGNAVYLFERDCSLQRRYQKVIEEAPAFGISEQLRYEIGEQAVKAAKAVNYSSVGTVEFLVHDNKFYFMEMNTRLQVEHPVTELITGLDLVELQISIANGQQLDFKQSDLKIHGHAIEARLYAEDIDNNFLPATGKINYLEFGIEKNNINKLSNLIRIDSGIRVNDKVNIYYDPMLAKIIAWGETREQAIHNLTKALYKTYLIGVKNNIGFLLNCLQHTNFKAGNVSTSFIDNNLELLTKNNNPNDYYFILVAIFINCINNRKIIKTAEKIFADPWDSLNNFRVCLPDEVTYSISNISSTSEINVNLDYSNSELIAKIKNNLYKCSNFSFRNINDSAEIEINIENLKMHVRIISINNLMYLFDLTNGQRYIFSYQKDHSNLTESSNNGALTAPMPGTVIAVKVNQGSKINAGDALIILEAMKMEHTIYAQKSGVVKNILYQQGQQVALGAELLVVE